MLPLPPQIFISEQLVESRADHGRDHECTDEEERVDLGGRVVLHLAKLGEDAVCVGVGRAAEEPLRRSHHEAC